jgi:long-chain fatty acid transport protein
MGIHRSDSIDDTNFTENAMRAMLHTSVLLGLSLYFSCFCSNAQAQSFGVELQNALMPASGGMAGASIARPQDVTSAINANPATLSQFRGTQFIFGGAWAEATYRLQHDGGVMPNVGAFDGKSTMPGAAAGNIGVTQELEMLGRPVTMGMGFITAAGGGADFRHIAASNGTNSALQIFELTSGAGFHLTDQLSLGAAASLGIGLFDGPFVGIGGMTPDYALRGSLGIAYDLNCETTLGFYYQTAQSFRFDNAIRLDLGGGGFDIVRDINMDLPPNLGWGISNTGLMDGNLLLSLDLVYKLWDEAELFRVLYDNQFVVQVGSQYSLDRWRFRLGYAWAANPLDPNPGISAGGISPPGLQQAIQYSQGLMAVTNPHRITAGVGLVEIMPGMNLDLMAGGMFNDSEQIGTATSTSLASYWLGMGLSWQFGAGAK